ncbi:hypothetical protein D0Y65_004884 [Glycine soja]|uniref:Disease resistance protein At4g27190-like leucine-rich repeats domain-containing protein n=1 Tax=Glycine soja TaxID=3848 RepID=A0A445LT47_GLYSO|nr:hypothetical protein D0Y65_004884 [Glycine soja]
MHAAINFLRESCLLLHAKIKEKVKMHDLVRDVALWIASETGQEILAGDISILESLQALEILDLRGSSFDGILALKKLKLLDLLCSGIEKDNAYEDLILRAEYFHLMTLEGGCKNVIPSIDPQGMNQLIFLFLKSCPEIECLFGSTNANLLMTKVVFCNLVTLRLSRMHGLQEVFSDPSSQCFLKNLQELEVEECRQLHSISFPRNSKVCSFTELKINGCPMLTSLFMPSSVQTLELLEVLEIYDCSELKRIIEEVEEGNVEYVSNQSHISLALPKLRSLYVYGCHRLEYIFPVCFARGLGLNPEKTASVSLVS